MRMYIAYPFIILLSVFHINIMAQPLCSYRAKISDNDKKNSAGTSLTSAGVSKASLGAIIRQDRANYHQFKVRDVEDEGDCLFSDKQMRAKIDSMISSSLIDPKVIESIVVKNPVVTVAVYEDKLVISFSESELVTKNSSKPQVPQAGSSNIKLTQTELGFAKKIKELSFCAGFMDDFFPGASIENCNGSGTINNAKCKAFLVNNWYSDAMNPKFSPSPNFARYLQENIEIYNSEFQKGGRTSSQRQVQTENFQVGLDACRELIEKKINALSQKK